MKAAVTAILKKPKYVFALYITALATYAALYYFVSGSISVADPNFVTCLYFSIVTLATVGYGDIHPQTEIGMLLASTEALFGIVTIGLFLNSLWLSYTDKIGAGQRAVIQKQAKLQNDDRIALYWFYLRIVLSEFKYALAELTTPMADRYKASYQINPSFKFSDLQDMYRSSLLLKNGFGVSTISLYYERADELISELKYFLSNFNLKEYPALHRNIIAFLTVSRGGDTRSALLGYEKHKHTIELIEKMIKEIGDDPDPAKYQSNVITPVIFLTTVLRGQISFLEQIEADISKIAAPFNATSPPDETAKAKAQVFYGVATT